MVETSHTIESQSNQVNQNPIPSPKWWAMLGIGMGVLMFALDVYIVNIALPIIVKSLHTNFATIQWVILSYLLILTVMVLGAGRLGDMWNKKWLYISGLIVFSISSLLCGLAPTVGFLIAFRVFQGLGAVFMSALGPAIITEVFPKEERGRALGIIGGVFLLGIALGPTVGGLLISVGSWRLIFLVNVPLGIIASLIVALVVPASAAKETKSFDTLGAMMMTITLTCFAVGMTWGQHQGFNSPQTLILLVLAAMALACFLVVETRVTNPMLDLKLFNNLELSLGLLLSSMAYVVIASVIFILPFFLELVKDYPTQEVGLLLAVSPMIAGVMAPISGTLSDRFGPRIISLIGLFLMASGCLAISTFDTELTVWGFIIRILPYGLGLGMFISPNNSAVLGTASQDQLGVASGLLSLSRTLGQSVGLPVVGALFSTIAIASTGFSANMDITNAPVEALVAAVQITFRIAAPLVMISAIIAAFLWWRSQNKEKISS